MEERDMPPEMLRRKLTKEQRDELLAACERLCKAIRLIGHAQCVVTYGVSISQEYVEEHWLERMPMCISEAYHIAQAAIAAAKGEPDDTQNYLA